MAGDFAHGDAANLRKGKSGCDRVGVKGDRDLVTQLNTALQALRYKIGADETMSVGPNLLSLCLFGKRI